jgi:hypothetical protein
MSVLRLMITSGSTPVTLMVTPGPKYTLRNGKTAAKVPFSESDTFPGSVKEHDTLPYARGNATAAALHVLFSTVTVGGELVLKLTAMAELLYTRFESNVKFSPVPRKSTTVTLWRSSNALKWAPLVMLGRWPSKYACTTWQGAHPTHNSTR